MLNFFVQYKSEVVAYIEAKYKALFPLKHEVV